MREARAHARVRIANDGNGPPRSMMTGPPSRVEELPVTEGRIPVRIGPERASTWLVLTHGAGGTIDDPLTSGLAARLRDRGLGVVEATFLYRAAGRKMPDRMPVLERALVEVSLQVTALLKPERLFLGGKSMGGRVAARIAKTLPSVRGICALSYPLRPPSKVTEANLVDRAETLRSVGLPMFIAQGTKDPFGGPEEISLVLPGATIFAVDGGDHDLATKGGRTTDATLDALAVAVANFMTAAGGAPSGELRAGSRVRGRSRG